MTVRIGTIERMASDLAVLLDRAAHEIDTHDGNGIEDQVLIEGGTAAREFSDELNSGEQLNMVIAALRAIKGEE